MLKSMTGFGKGFGECSCGTVSAEIRTVNSKGLDLQIKLPRELYAFEGAVKKAVQRSVIRGKTDVFITFERSGKSETKVRIDWAAAKAYFEAEKEAAEKLGVEEVLTTDQLFRMPDVFSVEREEPDVKELEECVAGATAEAVAKLLAMREGEGAHLKAELETILGGIKEAFETVRLRAPFVAAEYRDRLRERIAKLLDQHEVIDEQRLAQEVAIFADRSDISEETARIESHVKKLEALLESGGSVGRELDFVVQEFKREINTLGAKCSDNDIFSAVLVIKGKLEMFREQIQNIE